jgi:hypothetical protein
MKAKKVYEFKQGMNPYKTMDIGGLRSGQKFECTTDICTDSHEWILLPRPNYNASKSWNVKTQEDINNTIELSGEYIINVGEFITLSEKREPFRLSPNVEDFWWCHEYRSGFTESQIEKYFKRI